MSTLPYLQKEFYKCDQVKDPEIGDYSGLLSWVQYNHIYPYKREAGESSQREKMCSGHRGQKGEKMS